MSKSLSTSHLAIHSFPLSPPQTILQTKLVTSDCPFIAISTTTYKLIFKTTAHSTQPDALYHSPISIFHP